MGVVIGKWGITLAEANHATSHVYKTWALLVDGEYTNVGYQGA